MGICKITSIALQFNISIIYGADLANEISVLFDKITFLPFMSASLLCR